MARGRTFNREQVYVCGDWLDGDIYPVFQPAGRRRKKCRPSSAVQQRLNQRNAEKKLTRLAHGNFGPDDLAMTLTYREDVSEADAARLLGNYLKTLRRNYRKEGIELKYIQTTERGSKHGRLHHHLILSGGPDRDRLERLWKHGYANTRRLQFGEHGLEGLTHYMAKERVCYRRWSGSRNLTRPEPAQTDGQLSMTDVHELAEYVEDGIAWRWFEERYPDFILIDCAAERNGINRGVYIRFEMRRRESIWEVRA